MADRTRIVEREVRHENGTVYLLRISPYYDQENRPEGVVVALVDISNLRRAEKDLALHRDHLEDLVKQRTIEIQKKTAEVVHSNRELELYASVISHDLKEPLRMVTGFLSMLKEQYGGRQLDEKAADYIAMAADGAMRMQRMIDDLLAYSHVGKEGEIASVDLNNVVSVVLKNLEPVIRDCGANVVCNPLPAVKANPMEMTQLFQNLIANAVKFRAEKTPEVRISAQRLDAQGRQLDAGAPVISVPPNRAMRPAWLFSVQDNGIGIDPLQAKRIFQIFERLHEKGTYPGTGIGLSICQKIVERYGGVIWVEGEKGKGSTFHFTIPT